MTEYIAHRINNASDLRSVPKEYGLELDLRDNTDGSIYISHDPFKPGEDFEEFLSVYASDPECSKGTMILNVKSERIEHRVLELTQKYGVEKYFFLDSSFPMIKLLSDMGERNIAVRFSEFEGLDTVLALAGRIEWVWVDCFTSFPLNREKFDIIKKNGFKICIVSPELQGCPERIGEFGRIMKAEGIIPDAVCTKIYNIVKWKEFF